MSYGAAPLGTRPHGAVDAAAGPVSHNLAGDAQAIATASGLLYGTAALEGAATAQATVSGNVTHDVPLASQPVIYARPASTIAVGSFLPSDGTSPLHTLIDEATPDDADYIYANGGVLAEFGLPALVDPGFHTGHVLRARLWASNGWAEFFLRQGATTIADWYFYGTAPATPTTFELRLTEAQAASITDYADLRIVLAGLLGKTYFSWAEFAIEQGGTATATANITHGVPLVAAASATATAAGGLAVGKPLAAAVVAQAAASATIAAAGSVDLAASAAAVATAAGAVSHGVTLAATVSAVAAASVSASVGKPLAASVTAQAAASATVTATGDIALAGAATAVAGASANAAVLKALYAAAAGNAQASAALGIVVGLVGGALAQAMGAAVLDTHGNAALTGAASAQAQADGTLALEIGLSAAAISAAISAGSLDAQGLLHGTPGWRISRPARNWRISRPARNWRIAA